MRKNQRLTAEIDGCTSQGFGVAHVEGRAVFVKGAIPGEICEILIVKVTSTAVYGRLMNIVHASPHRITPCCPKFGMCGGCDFLHMDYQMETSIKKRRVEDALQRIGGINTGNIPILSAKKTYCYRNKVQFPVAMTGGRPEAGFFRARSHELIPVGECRIQFSQAAGIARTIMAWMRKYDIQPYDEASQRGYIRHIYLRRAEKTRQTMVCIVANTDHLPKAGQMVEMLTASNPEITTILLNVNPTQGNVILGDRYQILYGPGKIMDELCGMKFLISAASFYQVNHDQTENLYRIVAELAGFTGNETLLDLYCGIGTISLVMSKYVANVIGIEIVPDAVKDAKENARMNAVANAEFLCEDAETAAQRIEKQGLHPDVITLDPPRKGISAETVDTICRMHPSRIVYVSCDPATLARDLRIFCKNGYEFSSAQAVDMFPRCKHVETVVLMSRRRD